jgi:hypothetical protein
MADSGWAGIWKPMVVSQDTLAELQDLAGAPQYKLTAQGVPYGLPMKLCKVSLEDGTFQYPA